MEFGGAERSWLGATPVRMFEDADRVGKVVSFGSPGASPSAHQRASTKVVEHMKSIG